MEIHIPELEEDSNAEAVESLDPDDIYPLDWLNLKNQALESNNQALESRNPGSLFVVSKRAVTASYRTPFQISSMVIRKESFYSVYSEKQLGLSLWISLLQIFVCALNIGVQAPVLYFYVVQLGGGTGNTAVIESFGGLGVVVGGLLTPCLLKILGAKYNIVFCMVLIFTSAILWVCGIVPLLYVSRFAAGATIAISQLTGTCYVFSLGWESGMEPVEILRIQTIGNIFRVTGLILGYVLNLAFFNAHDIMTTIEKDGALQYTGPSYVVLLVTIIVIILTLIFIIPLQNETTIKGWFFDMTQWYPSNLVINFKTPEKAFLFFVLLAQVGSLKLSQVTYILIGNFIAKSEGFTQLETSLLLLGSQLIRVLLTTVIVILITLRLKWFTVKHINVISSILCSLLPLLWFGYQGPNSVGIVQFCIAYIASQLYMIVPTLAGCLTTVGLRNISQFRGPFIIINGLIEIAYPFWVKEGCFAFQINENPEIIRQECPYSTIAVSLPMGILVIIAIFVYLAYYQVDNFNLKFPTESQHNSGRLGSAQNPSDRSRKSTNTQNQSDRSRRSTTKAENATELGTEYL
eukprot:g35.t1